jgi:hypothetical protein
MAFISGAVPASMMTVAGKVKTPVPCVIDTGSGMMAMPVLPLWV